MVKNLLSEIAKEIYHSLKGEEWQGFLTLKPFLKIMNEYKNGKYAFLFSDIDVDLRNSFAHGEIEFPNNEVIYYSGETKKVMNLETLLSKFKKLPPLYACLFSSRLKPFRNEIIAFAKEKGYC